MEIILKVQLDRADGKSMSGELVGEELAGILDGESVDVEDSQYDVISVEPVANVKGGKKVLADDVLLRIDHLFKVYHDENPLNLLATGEEPKKRSPVDEAVVHLMFAEGIGEAITQARMRQAKKELKGS